MKKIICISFALVMLMFASAEKSFACSCVITPDPQKKQIQNAFIGSDAIFSGEVLEIKESPSDKNSVIVRFKVAKTWKGELEKSITIITARESAMCGFNFEVGKTYLVYAGGLKDNLAVNNCSRTAVFSGKGDAKYLDKLKSRKKKILEFHLF